MLDRKGHFFSNFVRKSDGLEMVLIKYIISKILVKSVQIDWGRSVSEGKETIQEYCTNSSMS